MKFEDKHEKDDFIEVYFYKSCNVLDISCTEDNRECVVQLDKETLGDFIDHLNEMYEELK